jgi:hypothetical protein
MLGSVRVTVSIGALLPELIDSLRNAGCFAAQLSDHTCAVRYPRAVDERELRSEVEFFVRAWQLTRPSVAVAFD